MRAGKPNRRAPEWERGRIPPVKRFLATALLLLALFAKPASADAVVFPDGQSELAVVAVNRLTDVDCSVGGVLWNVGNFHYPGGIGWQADTQTVNSETRGFSYGYGGELLSEAAPGFGGRTYINGGVDHVLWSRDSAAGVPGGLGPANFWLADLNGSVYGLTNAAGGMLERQRYDSAYGQGVFTDPAGNPIFQSTRGNRVGFQGRPALPELGLHNFRNRFYDPSLGRFLSRDPLGLVDGPAVYAFCGGDPVNRSDPMGAEIIYGTGASKRTLSTEDDYNVVVQRLAGLDVDERNALHSMVLRKDRRWFSADYTVLRLQAGNEATDIAAGSVSGPQVFVEMGKYQAALGAKMAVDTALEIKDQGATIMEARNMAADAMVSATLGDTSTGDMARAFLGVYSGEASVQGAARQSEVMVGMPLRDSYCNAGVENIGWGIQIGTAVLAGRLAGAPLGAAAKAEAGAASAETSRGLPAKTPSPTPWGARDPATGKFTVGARGGLNPVDDFIAQAEKNGFKVVGREVQVNTPFGARRYDVLLRNRSTLKSTAIEIKSSESAFERFDEAARQQFAADRYVNRYGADAVGRFKGTRIEETAKILWEVPAP